MRYAAPNNSITHLLGVPSPKEEIYGNMSGMCITKRTTLSGSFSIAKEVITVAQNFLRLRNEDLLAEDEIIYINVQ